MSVRSGVRCRFAARRTCEGCVGSTVAYPWNTGGVSVEHRWRIRGNTGGVSVETNVGTLDAQASLITVPTGLLNKIALQFDRDIFETEADT